MMKRCSKCKRQFETLTKRKGAVYCDTCLAMIDTPRRASPFNDAGVAAAMTALMLLTHRRVK